MTLQSVMNGQAGAGDSQRLEPRRDFDGEQGGGASNASQWDETGAVRAAAHRELHADLVRIGAERTAGIAFASAVSFAIYLAAASLMRPQTDAGTIRILLAGFCASALTYLCAKLLHQKPDLVRGFSYIHLFGVSFVLGLLRHHLAPSSATLLEHVSPVVIPILVYSALVPALPRAAGVASFGAAAMDPLALVLLRAHAVSESLFEIGLAALSPVLAACIAQRVSALVHRLNEGLVKAQEIGSYRLVERLGAGAMAEVWRADHRMLARPAAVKVIRPEVLVSQGPSESQRLLRHFLREARTTASLNSPHTIHVYDFGIAREGAFYYVMELLDGVDLQQLVDRFGRLPAARVAHVLRQICHSLDEAHARSFVHRDIKPANVYLCHLGEDYDFVKVLDFGLVLDRHPTPEELEDERHQVGTPAVMAPEMVRFQAPVDARADLYALGCVAYWLLTGTRVFEASNRQDMLVMHAHQKPIPPSRRAAIEGHPELEQVVMDCLEKNPAKRPQSARDLATRLAALKFAEPWSAERAEAWWKRMRPTAVGH